MTTAVEKLAQDCESLSLEEMTDLHDLLAIRIHGGAAGDEMDAAWSDELRRRVNRITAGNAKSSSAEQVFARSKTLHS